MLTSVFCDPPALHLLKDPLPEPLHCNSIIHRIVSRLHLKLSMDFSYVLLKPASCSRLTIQLLFEQPGFDFCISLRSQLQA